MVYVLVIFPKTITEVEKMNQLIKLNCVSKFKRYVNVKTLMQSTMGIWLTLLAKFNVSFLEDIVGLNIPKTFLQ